MDLVHLVRLKFYIYNYLKQWCNMFFDNRYVFHEAKREIQINRLV